MKVVDIFNKIYQSMWIGILLVYQPTSGIAVLLMMLLLRRWMFVVR